MMNHGLTTPPRETSAQIQVGAAWLEEQRLMTELADTWAGPNPIAFCG